MNALLLALLAGSVDAAPLPRTVLVLYRQEHIPGDVKDTFFLPTHQVNALIMGPAGYRVADFMRAGGIMTLLFITVLMIMMNLVF